MKTNLKLFTLAIFALVSFIFATAAMAQTSTTGTVEGVVTDPNGAVVSGASVTLSGPNLIRAQSTTSDNNGMYRFSQVPPGRYMVGVGAISGFQAAKQENVEVNLSRATTANFTMTAGGASATVDVVGTSDIDQTRTETGSSVSTEQFSNFPTARTVQSLYTIAPTVTRSGLRDASGRDRDPSVAGSSGPENNYILDGVNTTDPAFGGSGANLPFEFVQEVQVKTGAFGAEYGRATGGIFNVITKSGGNDFHGDVFGYLTAKSFVRDVKATALPMIGVASSKFSDVDAGVDIGGPIMKDKLWFFGAFNPQIRKNEFLTQTFHIPVENKITTPFYAGKLTWGINDKNTFTFSTFGDRTKQEGFLFGLNARVPNSGFGSDLDQFRGTIKTYGENYTGRLNSTFGQNWIGEFMFGLHKQTADTIPLASEANNSLVVDNFAANVNGVIAPVMNTSVVSTTGLTLAFVDGRGGTLARNYTRNGFGLVSNQDRDRWETAARMQKIWGSHTLKFGFEYNENKYKLLTTSSGPARTFADPNGEEAGAAFPATSMPGGVRVTNRYGVCTVAAGTTVAQCPISSTTARLNELIAAGQGPTGITSAVINAALTPANLSVNPILVLQSVRVRDFFLNTGNGSTKTKVESFYFQDDYKVTRNLQINVGGRWDYEQISGTQSSYIKLNNWWDNFQPRVGFIWDFTGDGKSKLFANYARYVEAPLPLDVNVRAGGDDIQLDRNANVSLLNGAIGSVILAGTASGLGCLGCEATPVDAGLKPQTVNEFTMGFERLVGRDFTIGARGIYRTQGSVIEDGSFDDGEHYFLFNPGEPIGPGPGGEFGNTEFRACNDPSIGCFGRARRYYRAVEFTATKRFSHNWQLIASYVYSSLIGNYEGLFRNDNGQADPNITSLFDLPSLLGNTYGRLPNDRPHQFKTNGTYQTPWKLVLSGNFYIQSGIPFNQLIPHPVYGDNEGFGVPRGTAINPFTGSTRTPTTYQVDMGAYYPFKFGEKREFRIMFDWFNVTNTQRAIRQDETYKINSGLPGAPNPALQFSNAGYGYGTVFQFPSNFRLGAKFSF